MKRLLILAIFAMSLTLNANAQDKEKKTQEKVDAKKAEALKSRQKEKNW